MDAVDTRFGNITTANGYLTNIGGKYKQWFVTAPDDSQMDMITVRDTIDTQLSDPQGPNSGKHRWALTIVADAIFNPSDTGPVKARQAIADIKKAIAVDQRWGGLATRTQEVSDQIMIQKEGTRVAGAQVIFKIITSRQHFEP